MKLTIATKKAIQYACLKFHYSHSVPVNPLGFNVYNDNDEWCGVILFAAGANNHLHCMFNLEQGQVLELVRVALNGKQEHTSQCVVAALKMLHKECPLCKIVVSYADCDQSHLGTIYQATNWMYTGLMNEGDVSAFIINGKKTHKKTIHKKCRQTLEDVRKYLDPYAEEFRTKGKHKYLFFFDKRIKKRFEYLSLPYPKNEGWVKKERSEYAKK